MSELKSQMVRKGFWIGIGLIIPMSMGILIGNQLTRYSVEESFAEADFDQEDYLEAYADLTKSIVIDKFQDKKQGSEINILGTITNKGSKPIGSIQLEAEFFNDKGEFVHEQTEYISKKIAPNESENFQIACGCKDKVFPEYKNITVRVVSAHAL